MKRAWYSNTISEFTKESVESIIGKICMENDLDQTLLTLVEDNPHFDHNLSLLLLSKLQEQ